MPIFYKVNNLTYFNSKLYSMEIKALGKVVKQIFPLYRIILFT
jgi:hypothetical protein